MAEDNRDPFDFEDDPLAGAEDLDVPGFGEDHTQAFPPPTSAPGVPPVASQPPGQFPPPSASPPPSQFPPPVADQFPPPQTQSVQPPQSPSDFAPPAYSPPEYSSPPVDTTPPDAPLGYGDFSTPGETPYGTPPATGIPAAPGAPGMPPSYPPPGQAQYGAGVPSYAGAPPGGPPPAQKKRRGCLFWGLLFAGLTALLIGGCTAALYFTGKDTTDKANDFLERVESADYAGAADLTNGSCGVTPEQIESELGGATSHFIVGVGPIASGEVTIDGESSSITFEFRDDQICSYILEPLG